jgi:alanine racemase
MEGSRWAWAEVDLGAVMRNVRTMKARIAPGALFMAVVKADGYGHGAVRVARAALLAGADRLGVATVDEALDLRDARIDAPVLLLSEPPIASVSALVERAITPTVQSRGFAEALGRAAAAHGVVAPFHLKVDTGMNRAGVPHQDASDFLESLAGLPALALEGVFTHFACADVPGDWEQAQQMQRFSDSVAEMRARGIRPGIVHAANSAATILRPETHLDMVRCGIVVYGLHPAASTHGLVELEPAMSVKARVTRVARVPMGAGVSYGMTWHASSPTAIVTLPLGYADGVRRGLSNRMRVLIGGRECSQVGRICMDQLMVEAPRTGTISPGDEAVVVGRQGALAISMEEQAATLETIDYEVACGYGARLTRVYVGE